MSDSVNEQSFRSGLQDVKGHVSSKVDDQTKRIESLINSTNSALQNYDRRIQGLEQTVKQLREKINQTHNFVTSVAPNERRTIANKIDNL